MESTLRRHLETCAAAFAKATGREPSTVARLSTGDWRFFERLKEGSSFTARKYDAIMVWFCINWPANVPWPSSVPRTSHTGAANDAPDSEDDADPRQRAA